MLFISSMNVGKLFKVFQSKVHPNQTKAHLKGLIKQEPDPIKLFSAELPESTLAFQIYQHIALNHSGYFDCHIFIHIVYSLV